MHHARLTPPRTTAIVFCRTFACRGPDPPGLDCSPRAGPTSRFSLPGHGRQTHEARSLPPFSTLKRPFTDCFPRTTLAGWWSATRQPRRPASSVTAPASPRSSSTPMHRDSLRPFVTISRGGFGPNEANCIAKRRETLAPFSILTNSTQARPRARVDGPVTREGGYGKRQHRFPTTDPGSCLTPPPGSS